MRGKQRHPERVVVLALDGVYPFELGMPSRILGAADGRYEVLTCTVDGAPVHTDADFTVGVEHGPEVLETMRHRGHRPGVRLAGHRGPPRRGRRRPRPHPPRHPDRVHLHRRLLPGRRRSPRRPPGHHPLAARRRVPPDVPARRPRPGRPVRRRRPGADLGGRRLRRRHLPPPHPQGPRQRPRQHGGPPLCRPALPGRRPGPVHRTSGARGGRHQHGRHPRLGPAAPRRTPHPRRPRGARPDEPAHLRPPLPRRGGPQPRPLADPAAGGARPAPAGVQRPHGGPGRRAGSASPPAPRCASTCTRRSASRPRRTARRSRRPAERCGPLPRHRGAGVAGGRKAGAAECAEGSWR